MIELKGGAACAAISSSSLLGANSRGLADTCTHITKLKRGRISIAARLSVLPKSMPADAGSMALVLRKQHATLEHGSAQCVPGGHNTTKIGQKFERIIHFREQDQHYAQQTPQMCHQRWAGRTCAACDYAVHAGDVISSSFGTRSACATF